MTNITNSLNETTPHLEIVLNDFSNLFDEISAKTSKTKGISFKNQVGDLLLQVYKEVSEELPKQERGKLKETSKTGSNFAKDLPFELKRISSLLEEVISHLSSKEGSKLEAKVASILKKGVEDLTNQVEKLAFPNSPELKDKWRELVNKAERIWRELQVSAPESPEAFLSCLQWFLYQGNKKDLNLLFKVASALPYSSKEIKESIASAQNGILKRNYDELLKFYSFSEFELLETLESTIEHYNDIQPITLKDYFKAECPTQVLEHLKEMQDILEEYVEEQEIHRWLGEPNKLFAGQSPRTALLNGYTFKVYQFLIGLAQGVHV